MVEEYLDSFQAAKIKAATRLGAPTRHLPSNSEVEQAIVEYQRLFRADTQEARLTQMRRAALEAMYLLREFNPRLAGPVLSGTAHEHADILLHLFADNHEEVALFLMERGIPYQLREHTYRSIQQSYPCYRFMAGEESIVLEVFPVDGIRHAPPSPVDGKPMRRADSRAVEALLVSG